MADSVVFDACVLYPAPLRDLLIRLALTGVFRARWTEAILDECFRSILKDRPDLRLPALARTRELMSAAIPDCLVTGYEPLVGGLQLPDSDDRHVLAAAIRCGAQVIVTANLADFPAAALSRWDVEAQHPDDFVMYVIDLVPGTVCNVVREQASSLRSPPRTLEELLQALERNGLVQSVARLRRLMLR